MTDRRFTWTDQSSRDWEDTLVKNAETLRCIAADQYTHNTGHRDAKEGDGSWEDAYSRYGDVESLLTQFRKPDLEYMSSMIFAIESAMKVVDSYGDRGDTVQEIDGTVMAAFGGVQSRVEPWNGEMATAFDESFIDGDRFGKIVGNQHGVMKMLRDATEALYAIHYRTRQTVDKLIWQTSNALHNTYESDDDDWAVAIAIVGVIAAVSPPGLALFLGVELAAVTAIQKWSAVDSAAPAKEDPKLVGDTVDEVIENLRTAVDSLISDIQNAEEKVQKVLEENLGIITSDQAYKKVHVPNSSIVDASKDELKDPVEGITPPSL